MASIEKLLNLAKKNFEEDEKVINLVEGAFEKYIDGKNTLRVGIMIATNKKLRFCGKRFFTVYYDTINYEDIYNVELSEEKLGYRIFIKGKRESSFLKFVEGKDVKGFVKYVNDNKGKKKKEN